MKSLHDYEEDRAEAGSRAGRTGTTAPSSDETSTTNDPSSSSAED